ncbi:MAG: hypothetical protein IJZ07_07010 [Clostridia bacterium]|nr:hypothetical protein [Clostridia bacterium]
MKCFNCGARVKKSEEICAECGAYISKAAKTPFSSVQTETDDEINTEELEKAEEYVRNIENSPEKYDFKDYLILPTLLKIGVGIAMIIISIVAIADSPHFFRASSVYSVLLFTVVGALSVFSGISSFIQERKCVLTVTDDRVFGTIPCGVFDTEKIDISIDDIIEINETGFHSKNSNPKVHIVTKEREITVKGSSKIMLSDFSDKLNYKIIAKENKNEN